jgi:hypothetical protein
LDVSALRTAALVTVFAEIAACGFDGMGTAPESAVAPAVPASEPPASEAEASERDGSVADAPTIGPDGETILVDGAPPAPELTLATMTPATAVDLEAEGTLGWIHWGTIEDDEDSRNEKATAKGAIPTFTLSGSTDYRTYEDNLTTFSWTNGSPTPAVGATRHGVYSKTGNPKFRLVRKAGVEPRRFVIYAGVNMCKGRFVVTLGDGPKMKSLSADLDNTGKAYGRFQIDYRTPDPTSDLVVTWELVTTYDPNNANVTLAAATLSPRP